MSFGNDLKNAARTALDFVGGGGESDKLKFSRYSGKDISMAVMVGNDVTTVTPKESVILEVNPSEISYTKSKLITKVPTSAPERFIIQDWGSDLTVMAIAGNTGNLMPAIIQSGGNPVKGMVDNIATKLDPSAGTVFNKQTSIVTAAISNNILMNNLTYTELISMSPKYRTFKDLESMYENFDSNNDLMILEMADNTYRGYFTDFSFTQTAESPWNWKYSMSFVELVNFNKLLTKGSQGLPSRSTGGSTSVDDS